MTINGTIGVISHAWRCGNTSQSPEIDAAMTNPNPKARHIHLAQEMDWLGKEQPLENVNLGFC